MYEDRREFLPRSLANRGYDLRLFQDYLGHRGPKHTAHDTRGAGHCFEELWR
jgi:type 1 fimbriae regulatory protein FimB